jgi:hypothetical protein
MKKQLVIIGIITLLVTVGLSGCDEDDDDNGLVYHPTQNPTVNLDGWYYVFRDGPVYIFNNTRISENVTYQLYFFEIYQKSLRIIVHKDSPGDIFISLGTSINNPILNFQTSDNTLDTAEIPLDFNNSNFYYIWSRNGDVNITILQSFMNFNTTVPWHFVKYEGD